MIHEQKRAQRAASYAPLSTTEALTCRWCTVRSPVMEVLRTDEALSQAADAVQCMVCQRLVEAVWQVIH